MSCLYTRFVHQFFGLDSILEKDITTWIYTLIWDYKMHSTLEFHNDIWKHLEDMNDIFMIWILQWVSIMYTNVGHFTFSHIWLSYRAELKISSSMLSKGEFNVLTSFYVTRLMDCIYVWSFGLALANLIIY